MFEKPTDDLLRCGIRLNTEKLLDLEKENLASDFYKRLVDYIYFFDKMLDDQHEVAIKLVSFDKTIYFAVSDLGYYDPSLICFYGTMENGTPVQLIQHISQINFLLMAMKITEPKKEKKPIGFTINKEKK